MASRPPPDFAPLLAGLARTLRGRRLPFMFIGGQAVLLHGAPRLTHDVDVTVGVSPERVRDVLAACEELGLEVLVADPAGFAEETFVLPARHRPTGVRVDFIFSNTVYERGAISRAVDVALAGEKLPFAAAEDLLLLKLFAGRPRDLEDARSIVRRQQGRLDWPYLEQWAEEFAGVDGREDLPRRLQALRSFDA